MRYAFYRKLILLYSLINMLLVNTPTVPNKAITEVHGIARGSTVRARNVGSDLFAGLKKHCGWRNLRIHQTPSRFTRASFAAHAGRRWTFRRQRCSECPHYHLHGNARLLRNLGLWNSRYRKMNAMIVGGIVVILLIYLIVQRIAEKEKENFEERDN